MIKKLLLLTAFGAGYVLGAKAGKERYEQIRVAFLRVKTDPTVQEKVHEAVDFAHEKGAELTDKAVQALSPEADQDIPVDLRPHGASIPADPLGSNL